MSSVLTVAQEVAPASTDSSGDSSDTNGQQDSSDTTRIDIAQRFSNAVEEFLTGLLPGNIRVKANWGLLAPIVGVIGDLGGVVMLAGRWL